MLLALSQLVNQAVGDAVADMLMVEAILLRKKVPLSLSLSPLSLSLSPSLSLSLSSSVCLSLSLSSGAVRSGVVCTGTCPTGSSK